MCLTSCPPSVMKWLDLWLRGEPCMSLWLLQGFFYTVSHSILLFIVWMGGWEDKWKTGWRVRLQGYQLIICTLPGHQLRAVPQGSAVTYSVSHLCQWSGGGNGMYLQQVCGRHRTRCLRGRVAIQRWYSERSRPVGIYEIRQGHVPSPASRVRNLVRQGWKPTALFPFKWHLFHMFPDCIFNIMPSFGPLGW